MAGAVVTAKVTGICNGHTFVKSKMLLVISGQVFHVQGVSRKYISMRCVCVCTCHLSNNEKVVLELVVGDFEVERRRSLPDPSGRVVVRPVARAVVAAKVAGVGDRHAAQMCADANDDQVLGVLATVGVGLGVAQCRRVDSFLAGNLCRRSVSDEEWLSPPLEGGGLALRDVIEVDLDLGQGQDVGGGAHAGDESVDHVGGGVSAHHTGAG